MREYVSNRRLGFLLAVALVVSCGGSAVAQTTFYPENDTGGNEVGFQGCAAHPPNAGCAFPLGTTGGSFSNERIGDDTGNCTSYTVLSFDMNTWAVSDRFVLRAEEQASFGLPDGLGPFIVEVLDSSSQMPSRFDNPAEVAGNAGYSIAAALAAPGLFAVEGMDITNAVRSILSGPHERYLYVRFRATNCTDGDGATDQYRMFSGGPAESRATRIIVTPNAAPSGTLIPATGSPGQPVVVGADIVDDEGPISARLFYQEGGEERRDVLPTRRLLNDIPMVLRHVASYVEDPEADLAAEEVVA